MLSGRGMYQEAWSYNVLERLYLTYLLLNIYHTNVLGSKTILFIVRHCFMSISDKMHEIFWLIHGTSQTFPHALQWLDKVLIFGCSDSKSTNTVGTSLGLLAAILKWKVMHGSTYLPVLSDTRLKARGSSHGSSHCFSPGYWLDPHLFICRAKILFFA